jgi:Cdc6-like AAA superfamily ATPase
MDQIKINPFMPNYPIKPGMFVGRENEIEKLEELLLQTQAGQPTNFMITGERGIGKSSLLLYVRAVAEGSIPINGNQKVKFLVIDTDITQNTTALGLMQKIELGLRNILGKNEKAKTFLKEAWNFLTRIEAGGVKINPNQNQNNQCEESMLEEFSYSLANTVNRICTDDPDLFGSQFDGVLILIDEADKASASLNLGSFFKLLMERLQRRECDNVMIGLAGLSDLHDVLSESHLSSLRLFEEIPLIALKDPQVNDVIDICLEFANEKNTTKVSIDEQGRKTLIKLSEGYPHFIQQFGYCAFAADKDNIITQDDVIDGTFGRRGALEIIGERYYRDDFYKKIQGENYRQVLRIMADYTNQWVTKMQIREKYKGKPATLNNAIKALLERRIILPKEGQKGIYRLRHLGFAVWIKFCTLKPEEFNAKSV